MTRVVRGLLGAIEAIFGFPGGFPLANHPDPDPCLPRNKPHPPDPSMFSWAVTRRA